MTKWKYEIFYQLKENKKTYSLLPFWLLQHLRWQHVLKETMISQSTTCWWWQKWRWNPRISTIPKTQRWCLCQVCKIRSSRLLLLLLLLVRIVMNLRHGEKGRRSAPPVEGGGGGGGFDRGNAEADSATWRDGTGVSVRAFVGCDNNWWIFGRSLHSLLHTTCWTSATIVAPTHKNT